MAYKPKAPEVTSDINVVPMADIMLVLLIIFMVVTPMLQKGFSVDMAKAELATDMPEADKEDAVVIAVSRDGKIFLGSEQVTLENLKNEVQDIVAPRTDKRIYIKSDARAKYGKVTAVVDEVRTAGVDQIGLLTDKVDRREPVPVAGGVGNP
ncbi:MAG: biopolymer transporter ExbD, partial [Candidatus Acidiferrales bacterium]